jgi:hypothetical protein
MNGRRLRADAALGCLIVLSCLLYLRSGLATAYLAADDFQWLSSGHALTDQGVVPRPTGSGFYRPLIVIWFATAARICGRSTTCYHLGSLLVHLANVALIFSIVWGLSRQISTAFLATLLFVVQPSYTQAVLWVSAITELSGAFWLLSSLQLQILSWRSDVVVRRVMWEILAVASFGCALASHEAAITLPVIAWSMWRQFGPTSLRARPVLVVGMTGCIIAFATTTAIANYRNPLFAESNYRIGIHIFQHAFDYFVGLYVGPGSWPAYAICVLVIALLLVVNPMTRFGCLWMLVTLTPYLGFVGGNVSRYSYVPSMGFALAIGAALLEAIDRLAGHQRARRLPALKWIAFSLATLFIVIRFGRYSSDAIRQHVVWTEGWRLYAASVTRQARRTPDGALHVSPPKSDGIDLRYVEPLVQWEFQDYRSPVVIEH